MKHNWFAHSNPPYYKKMVNTEKDPVINTIQNFDDTPREKCGVVAVYDPEGQAAQIAYLGIKALQHRGQDGAGISYEEKLSTGEPKIQTMKALGRVAVGFNKGVKVQHFPHNTKSTAHTLYSTVEAESPTAGLQPFEIDVRGKEYAISHNGQFDLDTLELLAIEHGVMPKGTDSELFTKLLEVNINHYGHIEPALHHLLPQLEGAFSLTIQGEEGIYGVRDRHGMRPLVIGEKGDKKMIASEVCGLEAPDEDNKPQLGFEHLGSVKPGTYVVINDNGVREERWSKTDKKGCIFEKIYLSKASNVIDGEPVKDYRFNAGMKLAEKETIKTNMVVPVLGSAKVYAHGYASIFDGDVSYAEAVLKNPDRKNPDSDRTFIEPTQEAREAAVRQKFMIDKEAVEGQDITLIDDSLVRGTTMKVLVEMLREAGAKSVHVRIGSERYLRPCAFGVNVQTKEELLSHNRNLEEMAEYIGADSLKFLAKEEMYEAAGTTEEESCAGCMGGSYPQKRDKTLKSVAVQA